MGGSSINWRLANRFGIWLNDAWDAAHFFDLPTKDRDATKDESPADPWNSGHATDILELGSGGLLIATATSGIWIAGEDGGPAICLSNAWPYCQFASVASGIHDPQREFYAGGEVLYTTNLTSPLPLFSWTQIPVPDEAGWIGRVLVMTDRIVLACAGGMWWSPIPATPGGAYTWMQAKVHDANGAIVKAAGFNDVAEGIRRVRQTPGGMVISPEIIAGGAGLYWGWWNDAGALTDPGALIIEQVILSVPGRATPELSRVSVTSCAADRRRAYGLCATPAAGDSPHLFAVVRSNDGGRHWAECGTGIEMDTPLSLADFAGHQGDYNNCIDVARWDPDLVAFGFNNTLVSFNGGASWFPQGVDTKKNYTSPRHLHADIHGLRFSDTFPGSKQNLYVASDGGVAAITWGNSPWMIESDHQSDGQHGDFEALVLEGNELAHYTRSSANLGADFVRQDQVVTSRATGGGCLVVSDFSTGGRHDYDAVVLEGSDLVHYWADNSSGSPVWNRVQRITGLASGPGCIVKSDYVTDGLGNLEVIVPEGSDLIHYWHAGAARSAPWQRTAIPVTTHAASAACFIQSDFGSGGHGNFELVVMEDNFGAAGAGLMHYWRDSRPPYPWQGPTLIDRNASSQASIFQTDYGSGDHGDFTVVVQAGRELVEWRRDNSGFPYPWQFVRKILGPGPDFKATGPACAFQSSYHFDSEHGNFEMAACVDGKVVHRLLLGGSPPWVGWAFGPTISNRAHTYSSRWNRQLPTLQLNSPTTASALGYGSMGVSAFAPGMVGSGSQDNGVVYSTADHSRAGELISPWFRLDGGDGNVAAFLPFHSFFGDLPAAGRIFIDTNNETEDDDGATKRVGAKSSHISEMRVAFYPGQHVVPLRKVNPSASPKPDPKKGVILPRLEVVTQPRFPGVPEWKKRGLMCAVAAAGSDIYGLFVGDAADEGQITPPLSWDYLGTAMNPSGDLLDVTAVGSRDGFTVILGTQPISKPGPTHIIASPQIYRLDSDTGNLSLMDIDPALLSASLPRVYPAAMAVTVISPFEAYAISSHDQVIRWDGRLWRPTATLPADAAQLKAITADIVSKTPIIFVAGASRVYVTADRGASWQNASAGLPNKALCSDIRFVHDRDGSRVYLSTNGRSVWVADQTVTGS